ncbi:zincin-like metallopeptidase domain-containing protein [uncultured Bradyrhizobium sp.]|jgi:antirestriction protein ArdC|uniref:ArdC family protein n=1 Tax=uncultured Bradyrhizobium sp. TaxID=199684 RepID=UPI002637FAB8|nr:zincin-like metallopeptidase domain-containing protein [uncultured Bradyrhizobium sp.]
MNPENSSTPRRDIYARVTNQIVAELERGVLPWIKPWHASHLNGRVQMPLRHNGLPYKGINVIALWMASVGRGYSSPSWMTYRQAHELGGQVRRGETGELVVYAGTLNKPSEGEGGEDDPREIHYLRGYVVFNADQIDGLPEQYRPQATALPEAPERIAKAESFLDAVKAEVRHGGDKAYYAGGDDYIQMPPFEIFRDALSYYATRAHETVHWTSHKSRLDRTFDRKRFGDEGYAMEELVAELGAAFLCSALELTPEVMPNHASYIDTWLEVLLHDKRAIFTAAAHAQRAADYLHGLQGGG